MTQPKRLLEAAHDLHRHRRAAGDAGAQARDVVARPIGIVEQRVVHRGHAVEQRDLVPLDDLQRLAGLEARDHGQARAGPYPGVQAAGLPEGVKQRQRAEDHVLLGDVHEFGAAGPAVLEHVEVRQLGALGRARGARGVEDHGRVRVVALDVVGLARGAREQGLELARLDDDHLGSGYLGAFLGRLREAVPREHQPRARIREVEADLSPLQQHVHRHDHAAGAQHAVVDGAEVRHVREHDPNAVAWLQTPLLQQAGHPGRALVEHVVGEDAVVELQRGPIAVPGCCLGQKLCEVGWHGIAPLFTRPFAACRLEHVRHAQRTA